MFGLMIAGSCGISLYWAQDSTATLILAALYISFASLASTTLVGSIVSMFPTSTRTMNVSLAMMFGRSGAIIGNMIFPILMTLGCLPLFGFIGASALSKILFKFDSIVNNFLISLQFHLSADPKNHEKATPMNEIIYSLSYSMLYSMLP